MSPNRHTTAIAWVLTLAGFLCAATADADDVALHNGNTFEGVIVVSENEDQVRIRLAHGEMSLPRTWIARIDRAESPLAGYLERRGRLRARRDAAAGDWIELARWARGHELGHGYKEALLEAAAIAPRLPELAPLLRGIGYVLEEPGGLWVSAAELRRAEEARLARERAAEERARRAEASVDDNRRPTEETLSRAIEALALAELERESRTSRREARGESTFRPIRVGTFVGAAAPLFPVLVAAPAPAAGPPPSAGPPPDPYAAVRNRLPGSLLSNRGRMNESSRPHLPGSLLSSRRR